MCTVSDPDPANSSSQPQDFIDELQAVRQAFKAAKLLYRKGTPCPVDLDGEFTLTAYDCLSDELRKWKMGFVETSRGRGRITIYGDPTKAHEGVASALANKCRDASDAIFAILRAADYSLQVHSLSDM